MACPCISHWEVATVLALQTLDLDVHWRKWYLTIQSIKHTTGEEDDVICKAFLDLAWDHLDITDVSEKKDCNASHRLNKRKDADIMIRLQDLKSVQRMDRQSKEAPFIYWNKSAIETRTNTKTQGHASWTKEKKAYIKWNIY